MYFPIASEMAEFLVRDKDNMNAKSFIERLRVLRLDILDQLRL